MPHIDYYFSTLSPFAYLAGLGLEEVAARHGAGITYKPLDIMTLFTRTGGLAPKDRHPSRMAYRAQELPRQAKKAGMPLNMKPAHWPTNAAPASYAIIAAQKAGGGRATKIMIDGGIKAHNIAMVRDWGVEVAVIGSGLINDNFSIAENLAEIHAEL